MSSRSRYNTPPNAPGFPGDKTQHEVEKMRRGVFERGLDVTGDVAIAGSTGIGTDSISSTAKLQIDSTTKGFLPPRMTTAERAAIASPDDGLVVYDTTVGALYCHEGGSWVQLSAGGGGGGGISTVSDADMLASSPSVGDVVYNTDTLSLWQFNGTFWLPAGPSALVQDLIEDFPNTNTSTNGIGTHGWAVGGGTPTTSAGVANHPGIHNHAVTANNTTIASFIGGTLTAGHVTGDEFRYACFIVRPLLASPSVGQMAVGLHTDATTSAPGADTTKILFHFDLASNTNWFAQTNDGGDGTSVDTGVAVTNSTWYRLEIYKIDSTVTFYIDGALVATINTTVPTTGRMFFGTKQRRASTSDVSLDHDYARLVSLVTR